jgi:signal transduction histidine kinase/ActR/RegA family two-component response regulator
MTDFATDLFEAGVWEPALKKFGAVARIVCGPVPSTSLQALFEPGHDPGLFAECAELCLAQALDRPAVIVAPYGLAVVGTSLLLEGQIVGAAVAGYALADFSQSTAIAQLARQVGIPFRSLWDVARRQQPVPERRLVLHGELLQVLGDTILRENYRTRQYESMAARLKTEVSAKDEFLAVLSHELRTPLTPILAWAQILKDSGDSPVHQARAAASIKRNVLLQIKLVDDLLDLNRVIKDKVSLAVTIQDLPALLRGALDTIADLTTKQGIDIEFIEPAEPLKVEVDAGRLQQVFVNVLSNAVKFTPAGGRVTVTAERDGDTAVVRVTDTGEGIAPAFLPHVFEMFRQQEEGTRRRHSGLGIGLALVKRLVELHQGSVEITSEGLGRGTEVMICLPLTHREALVAAIPKKKDLPSLKGLSILVVEDTEDTLDVARVMLEVLGARVLVGRNGFDALDVMAAKRPDLVLCDLRMPQMDGFEFMKELHRSQGRDHPPVVAVTGLVSEADRRRTEAAGFRGHLNKPYDDSMLVTAVLAALSEAPGKI